MPHRFLVSVILVALLAAVGIPARSADPIQVNVILALTGNAAPIGQVEHTSFEILAKRINATGGINGRQLQFTYLDDASNLQNDVQFTNQLIAAHAAVFLGPNILAACNAVAALVKGRGPVNYCLSPGVEGETGGFTFASSIAAHDLIAAEVRYFHDRGWRRVAWISSTDASGQDGETGFNLALGRPESAGMTVAAREHFNVSDLSVEAQLTRIKAAGVDAIVTWTSGAQMGTLLRGIQDVGLDKLPLMISAANLTYRNLKAYGPMLPANALSCANDAFSLDVITDRSVKRDLADMTDAFKAAGERPDYLSTLAWSSASIVIAALRRLGPDATAEDVRRYIAGLRGFADAEGRLDFVAVPQRGLNSANAFVVRWDAANDRFVPVSRAGGIPLR